MTTFHRTSPASLRPGSTSTNTRENQGSIAPDSRPYLVAGSYRKTQVSAEQYRSLFPHESEDARLTGTTRSLYRRLLALNLPGTLARFEAPGDYTAEVIEGVFGTSRTKIA
jgi:hypothetical protein